MKMKCVAILTICLVVTVSGLSEEFQTKLKSKLKAVAAVCIPETGANEGDIAELKDKKIPSRKEGKCLLACLYKKFGVQTEDGVPNKAGFLDLLEPIREDDPDFYSKMNNVAMKCGPQVIQMGLIDHCEIASELSACVLAEAKLAGIEDPLKMRS